mmetsp:Transcript_24513/g.61686  ORF Transcript_24513/g.61686 Transcript_24513/m.61686 type:complete len:142 (-) Transcript_24513:936-1361(-)
MRSRQEAQRAGAVVITIREEMRAGAPEWRTERGLLRQRRKITSKRFFSKKYGARKNKNGRENDARANGSKRIESKRLLAVNSEQRPFVIHPPALVATTCSSSTSTTHSSSSTTTRPHLKIIDACLADTKLKFIVTRRKSCL